eukprot:131198_1
MSQVSSVTPTILLTGASKGIGKAIALSLANTNKYNLSLLSRNLTQLKATAQLCKNINPNIKILTLQCDISNTDAFKKCIDKTAKELGPLCVIINNAGVLYKESMDNKKIDLSKIDQSIDINLRSLIHGSVYAIPYIKESKSKYPHMSCAIIQIGSRASTLRAMWPRISIYAATKFGVRSFTNCLFEDIGDFGIKVSCIMPGLVATEMVKEHSKSKDKMDPNKMLRPRDIAHAVNYVLSCSDTCCPLEMLVVPQYYRYPKL